MNTKPEVGMGVTLMVGSDRYPYTIAKISKNGKTIWVTPDAYAPTEKHDYFGHQDYTYTTNTERPSQIFTLRKNGRWVEKGSNLHNGCGLHIGHREAYQDPSF